jgi:glycosyltransferase involved in cell wall biosynthesis
MKFNIHLTKGDVIYSTSDLMPDAIPAIRFKKRFKEARWIAGLHLIAPNPFRGYDNKLKFPSISNMYYFITQRIILRYLRKYAYCVFVSNHLDKEFLLKKGFKGSQVMVTYGAVEKEHIPKRDFKKEYDLCFVGRAHPQKGINDLVYACSLLIKNNKSLKIAIVGEEYSFSEVKKEIKKKGIEKNFSFLGFLDKKEKFTVIKKSKIVVFPSYYESFGMVIAESLACGTPVIAYDLDIYSKIYGSAIIKVKKGNKRLLSKTIDKLLKDKKYLIELSNKGKNKSAEFSFETTGKAILKKLRCE